MMFPCNSCGLCCQNISGIKELRDFDLGNGVCKYYNFKTKNCNIYINRPDICNVEKMYKKVYFKIYSKKEFYRLDAEVCNSLQEKYCLNSSYRIKLEEI